MSSWTTPVTNWAATNGVSYNDLNRIESNTQWLHDNYLPLAGGTLTGDMTINGTNGSVFNLGSNNNPAIIVEGSSAGWSSGIQFNNTTASTGRKYGIYSGSDGGFHFTDETSGGAVLTISSNGAISTPNVTIDDGSGKMIVASTLYAQGPSNYISVGSSSTTTANNDGVIGFLSNGPNGVGGAYIEYFPPTSGTNTASELNICGAGGASLSTLNLLADTTYLTGNAYVSGGALYLNNGTSNVIRMNHAGVAPPANIGTLSIGTKLLTWDDSFYSYGIGVDSNTQWYSSQTYHKWYAYNGTSVGTAPTLAMTLDGNGNLTLLGDVVFNDGGEHHFKYDNGSTEKWGLYLNSTEVGIYDWTNNRNVLNYTPSADILTFGANVVQTSRNIVDDGSGKATFVGDMTLASGGGWSRALFFDNSSGNNPYVQSDNTGAVIFINNSTSGRGLLYLHQNGLVTTGNNTIDDSTGAVSFAGAIQKVAGTSTAGHFGVATTIQYSNNGELTTTGATQIINFTPPANGMYSLKLYLRVVTAATNVTATLTYDDSGGAQSYTPNAINNASIAVGSHSVVAYDFEATTAAPITLTVTAGTANQVFVTAALVGIA